MHINALCDLVDEDSEVYLVEARILENDAVALRLRIDCSLEDDAQRVSKFGPTMYLSRTQRLDGAAI